MWSFPATTVASSPAVIASRLLREMPFMVAIAGPSPTPSHDAGRAGSIPVVLGIAGFILGAMLGVS